MITTLNLVLRTISQAPKTQLDPILAGRVGALENSELSKIIEELELIIKECDDGAFATDFSRQVLSDTLNIAKNKE